MKVILYVGHHKVGSTSLQVFLSQNWVRLVRNGILYPMVESKGMSFALEAALEGKDQARKMPINVREPHNALAFRMMSKRTGHPLPGYLGPLPSVSQMMLAIKAQIERLKPHTVIICSEVLSNFGGLPDNPIRELKAMFTDAEFEIYCTLRRPDDYLVSWNGQRIRFGHALRPLRETGIKPYRKGIHFDYQKVIAPWISRFPQSPFHIRNYADVLAAGGSEADFMNCVGVDFPSDMIPATTANESLHTTFMEIGRRGNNTLPPVDATELFHFLLNAKAPKELSRKQDIEMFGTENRQEMLETFSPINDYLSEVTGTKSFFPDMENVAQTRPIPEEDATRIAYESLLRTSLRNRPSKAVWRFLKDSATMPAT